MWEGTEEAANDRWTLIEQLARGERNLTYSQACDLNSAEIPNQFALIDRTRRMTWLEVKQVSDRIAQSLLNSGLMRPDIVLIHLSNCVEQFLIRLACEKAGLRVILTNSAFREVELSSIIDRAGPRLAFISATRARDGHYDRLREILCNNGTEIDFYTVGISRDLPWSKRYIDLTSNGSSEISQHLLDHTRFSWGERFYLTTTSGSTSAPKIADTIFGNRIWLSLRHAEGMHLQFGEVIGALAPMTSGTSDTLIHHAAPYYGATVVIEDRFDPIKTCRLLVDEGVHIAPAVPTMLARMMAQGGIDELSEAPLRCFAIYAASISYELAIAVEERGKCKIVRPYGTMDFGGISMSTLDDDCETRIKTVGKPFQDNDVKIVGEDDIELAAGETGQIVMRPSQLVMGAGYYRDLEKTLESWNEEYYRLGDLGLKDEMENLILVGRGSELIIRAGQNIVPSEVEELMISHPKVVEVSVVGVPDQEMGERVCACIILNGDEGLQLDEVREHFRSLGVANFKCPERIVTFKDLPMTMSGLKIDKRRLLEIVTSE